MKNGLISSFVSIKLGSYGTGMMMFLMILSSCDVHQFPEKDLVLPQETVSMPLALAYSPHFYVWEHDYDPMTGKIKEVNPDLEMFEGYPGASSVYDNTQWEGIVDVHVKAFTAGSSAKLVKEQSFSFDLTGNPYDTSFVIDLPKDTKYRLAVWSHLRQHSEADSFYDPSDFNKVQIIGSNYAGNTDYRDGFSGIISLDTYEEPTEVTIVPMTRPMGKFELVTVDLSEFLDRETTRRGLGTRASASDYIVQISFPYYYPTSYSVLDDRLENSVAGFSFRTRMTVTGVSEASLGFEYVMINDIKDAGVQMRVDIYDPEMTHVAGSTTLTIPMRRDYHTLLRGEFLLQDNEGGVGLDPDFEGDFNIPL